MKKIIKERQKKKMSQIDLAIELKIHPSQLSKIERGMAVPYKPAQKKLEDFFNMSIDDLLQEIN